MLDAMQLAPHRKGMMPQAPCASSLLQEVHSSNSLHHQHSGPLRIPDMVAEVPEGSHAGMVMQQQQASPTTQPGQQAPQATSLQAQHQAQQDLVAQHQMQQQQLMQQQVRAWRQVVSEHP